MSGDSTTQATGTITDVENFSPTGMLTQLAFRKGFSRIAMNNRGFGGKTTRQWVDDYLNDDIALNPDLYIIRWGINDPINGRSPEQTISDLREGLFNFRSSANGSFDACTVVLMMPNIVGYITGGADETWIEKIRSGYRQAAFDFGCIFVDTPRLAPDAKRGSGRWMDDLGFLQAVHPRDVMNVWLFSQLADELWPTGLLHFSDTAIKNNTALLGNPRLKTDLPDTYKTGISIEFGNTTSGWFDSVILTTIKQSDGPCLQFINTYGAGPLGFVRIADSLSNAWTAITPLTPQDTNLIPASGFNLGAGANTARLTRNGNHVQLDGWFTMNDPTTLSAGVTIGSVPLGYRPTGNVLTSVVISNGSGSYEIIPATVELNGDVVARKNSTLSASVIAVQPIAFSTASIV
ncbi:SGNH/GDSL hydrolase family protein [Brucella anthropi]|uniref:SGNH/GDSL hydrolase family protein n=1 Tax=Brucella anthropi TaxID=529 RepID=UPI0026712C7E|nr:SGNH/GDSL hydrolase family protein [Brucella anthropi]WKT93203.1 SGNH/GDSL hydrolase family protein [Brucella anthropi]